jgi:hypothetical protein
MLHCYFLCHPIHVLQEIFQNPVCPVSPISTAYSVDLIILGELYNLLSSYMRFEVFMVMRIHIVVFCATIPYRVVGGCQYFRGT